MCLVRGTVARDFWACCWPVWMHLGLNKHHFWFLNYKEAPSYVTAILSFDAFQFKPSEILRIFEKDWQLSPRFSEIYLNCQLLSDTVML
jgi:hypothetical protein